MNRFAYVFFCLLVAACAASGVQVKEEQLAHFKAGETTIHDVVGVLGQPNLNMLNPDGTRMISYIYSEAAARPETFIPIVGAFVGGVDARSNVVMLQFDRDGKLMHHSASSSAIGTGTNFSSGVTPKRVEGQPQQAK